MANLSQYYGSGNAPTSYTESSIFTSSQTVSVPTGTKVIHALLCGGGGGGGNGSAGNWPGYGGGYGGLAIFDIPVIGTSISLVIGAGGSPGAPGSNGGTTSVSINGTVVAQCGGGGGGGIAGSYNAGDGLFGGGGGGGINSYAGSNAIYGGGGGVFHGNRPIWFFGDGYIQYIVSNGTTIPIVAAGGFGGNKAGGGGGNGSPGYGGGGGGAQAGGSMTSITVWGRTGYGAGTVSNNNGGGGGGFLAAGGNASTTNGGNGGNGGGGGGGGFNTGVGGYGGNGFAIFRWYQ